MSDLNSPENQEHEGRRYLFHKQQTEQEDQGPRRRPPNPRKPGAHKTVGHKHFMSSLRNAGMVFLLMGALLGIAVFTLNQIERIQKNRNADLVKNATIAEAPPMTVPLGPDILDPTPEGEDLPEATLNDEATELDIEAIRRAVFLAKRGDAVLSTDQEAAIGYYRQALESWPFLGDVWAKLGDAYNRIENYPLAQTALQRAARIQGDNPKVLADLGISLLYQNRVARALEFFEAARQIDGRSEKVYLYIALCHIAQEDYGLAEEGLNEYLKFAPNDAQALKEKAFLEAKRGRYDLALTSIKKAIAETPDWEELYWDAAGVCALIGRLEDAIRFLERGEAFTSPDVAYKIYQQSVFQPVRFSELGRIYEQEVAERARRKIKQNQR